MTWLCLTPERREKTRYIMRGLAGSVDDPKTVEGAPPDDGQPFAVWGQDWLTPRILPQAVAAHRPFWHVDNGFVHPAKGSTQGYYRLTYRSLSALLLRDAASERERLLGVKLAPWRATGEHVLIALPGAMYGHALGMKVPAWIAGIEARVLAATKRPVIVRPKNDQTPLAHHLMNCHALVTHSSNVAVDAVVAGVPVFVEPTSPAAPVGNLDLADLENPAMPDRTAWWRSLACQQFTLNEMLRGDAREHLRAIARQVDGG